MSYDNVLKADLPVFHQFFTKAATQGVNKKFHNFFSPTWILVDFGYVKEDIIMLRMAPISFISKFHPGPTLF